MSVSWSRVSAVVLRDFYNLRRNPPYIVEIVFWPTLELITWGCVSLFLATRNFPAAIAGLLGAVLLWQMACRPQGDLARCYLEDVWARNLINLYVSPLSTVEHLAGMVLCGAARVAASTVVLAVLSWVLYGFGVFTLGPALLPYVVTLLAMAWALGVFAIALVVRFGASAQAFAWLLAFAVQPFAAVFYPISVLPVAVQAIAHAVPASYIFEDMRAVLAGAHPSGGRLAMAAVLDVAYLAAAMVFLHHGLRHARVTGRLSRFNQ